MKDLQILEEQQRESHRKLQTARETKQRMEMQRASLEHELGDLKYRDGQVRAELAQIRQMLSTGQRKLYSVRSDADKAGFNLRDFDQYVDATALH